MTTSFPYLSAYPEKVQQQVQHLLNQNLLNQYLLTKYPVRHNVNNDKTLREFVLAIKNRYLKKSDPVTKITFDDKIHVINNALGLHSYVTRVQGNKIKRKNEIRIGTVFKQSCEKFLTMIVVHELAHLKEKDHNKNFYQLCTHMMPDYHQVELDLRIYLTYLDEVGDLY